MLVGVQNLPPLPVHPLPTIAKLAGKPASDVIAGIQADVLLGIGIREGSHGL
jgi:hypothetical protein